MKSILIPVLTLISLMGIRVASGADPRVDEVWTCKVNAGKSMDDVRAANSKWVKYINAHVKGGDISSSVVTPIVGKVEQGTFLYVDSFPNLESWTAAKPALDKTDEGKAIDAELNAAAACSENRLYSSEAS